MTTGEEERRRPKETESTVGSSARPFPTTPRQPRATRRGANKSVAPSGDQPFKAATSATMTDNDGANTSARQEVAAHRENKQVRDPEKGSGLLREDEREFQIRTTAALTEYGKRFRRRKLCTDCANPQWTLSNGSAPSDQLRAPHRRTRGGSRVRSRRSARSGSCQREENEAKMRRRQSGADRA